MKAMLITIVMILPCFVFGQSKTDEYAIYSSYFRAFNKERGGKHTFAIKISSNFNNYEDVWGIEGVLTDFRNFVMNKTVSGSFMPNTLFLLDSLKRDTLWLPLISKLISGIHKPHVIKNYFSKDLQVFLLPYNEYIKYFGDSENSAKGIGEAWASFHENYPDHGILVDLSEVVSDGKRAVFYFGWRCGGLCGDGSLILFYKDNSVWHLVAGIPMWYN